MTAVVVLSPNPLLAWVLLSVFAAVAWLTLRVPARTRRGVAVAFGLAVALMLVVDGIPVDVCAACRDGVMPEWWCWLNWCW